MKKILLLLGLALVTVFSTALTLAQVIGWSFGGGTANVGNSSRI